VLASRVRTLTDRLVKDPVVALIEFVDIELELLIFVDDIFVVCNVPVLSIFPLVVSVPEIVKLLQVDIFVDIIINIYFNFY
jgi:hypothetical protein